MNGVQGQAEGDHQGWLTRERILTLVLAVATVLAVHVCYLIAKPFVPAIAFALALAVATSRPYDWLHRRIRNESAAASVATFLVALLILGPAVFLMTYLVQAGLENLDELRNGQGLTDWRATVARLPYGATLLEWAESRLDLQAQVTRFAGTLAGQATGLLRGSVEVLTQLVVTLFVLFFLFRDRKRALRSLRHLVPLSGDEATRLFERVGSTIHATVNGSLTVAFVQSVLAGTMYWWLGVPGPVLWGAVTFITALIPVFGTFLVWGPIAIFLLVTGGWTKALILVGWGLLAVGTIDNLLYPYLVGDKLRLHTVPTFFAILGGIGLFGPAGLILGPLALAVTTALIDVWWRRTVHGHSAEEEVAESDKTTTPPGAVLQSTR